MKIVNSCRVLSSGFWENSYKNLNLTQNFSDVSKFVRPLCYIDDMKLQVLTNFTIAGFSYY
jgi:hypothetical protein